MPSPTRFESLHEFALWWVDEGRQTACCQTSDAETVATDADVFDCDTCDVARRFAALAPENADAWQCYHRLCTRFAVETQSVGVLLAHELAERPAEERDELVRRLAVLYDVFVPVRKPDGA